jgi:ATP-dependent DNA helicase RecG
MKHLMEERGLSQPEYEETASCFIVTFKKEKSGGLNGRLNGRLNGGLNGGLNEQVREQVETKLELNWDQVSEGLKTLIECVWKKPGIQVKDISIRLDRPIRTIERQIKKLRSKEIIERRGSKKTGGYYIK